MKPQFYTAKENNAAFTLVELLVAIAISGIVLAAVTKLFISTNRIYTVQKQVVHLQQTIRASLNIMSRDIRMAGLDPTGNADAGIESANSTNLRIKYDYNGSGTCDRDRNYQYNTSKERLEVESGGSGGFSGLSEEGRIQSMSFDYLLEDGTSSNNPTNPDKIRSVTVSVCGQITGAYADARNNTYCFNNTVTPRNMGL